MKILNKTFYKDRTLKAAELNSIVSKINEIIANFPSSESDTDPVEGVTEQDIIDKVNAAKAELLSLIDSINGSIASLITQVQGLKEGKNFVDSDEEFLRAIKQQCDIVLLDLNVAKRIIVDGLERIVPAVDLAVLLLNVNTLNTLYAGLSALPGQVGIMANWYERLVDDEGIPLLDDDGNEIWVPKYNGAEIIASINESGDSTVGINANKIIISGETTLTDNLSALSADISNINVPDTATITQAVINDIEAGNVTITGTLRYNKILGNVESVSSGIIPANAYLVQFTGPSTADVNQYPEVLLPSNPDTGQTIFITVGTKCWKLKATTPIDYFYKDDPLGNSTYLISSGRASANDAIDVFNAGWNGVVQFIYTGSAWQLLIHNIRI